MKERNDIPIARRIRGEPFLALIAAILLLAVWASGAVAQTDKALAESLFDAGRALMDQGRFEEACAKFRDSQRVDASSGTALNLADCLARRGKTASAWAEFLEAARLAQAQARPDRVAEAERRAEELEAELSFLTVTVQAPVEGLRVFRDEVELKQAAWNTPVAVDPGMHVLRAEAPGHAPFQSTIDVGARGDEVTARIAPLEPLPPEPDDEPEPEPPAATEATASTPTDALPRHRALGYSLLGGGAAVLAAGIAVGFVGKGAYDAAEATCGGDLADCPQSEISAARDDRDRAETLAWTGNALGAAGIAAAITGSVLLIVGRKRARADSRAVRLDVAPTADGGQLTFSGNF